MVEFIEGRNGMTYLSQIRAMEADFIYEGVDIRTIPYQSKLKTPNFSQLTSRRLEEYFKSGKIPTKSLLAMSNETKLKLVEALGP